MCFHLFSQVAGLFVEGLDDAVVVLELIANLLRRDHDTPN